jgi:hypothetical protein
MNPPRYYGMYIRRASDDVSLSIVRKINNIVTWIRHCQWESRGNKCDETYAFGS